MKHVRYWVDAALDANWRDHTLSPGNENTGPFKSARALGMVLVAMHDAFGAVTGGMAPYATSPPAPAGLRANIAMSAAAYHVLDVLYPGQAAALASTWSYYAAAAAPDRPSVAFGTQVANDVLAWRAGDAPFFGGTYKPTKLAYDHDVDPLHPGQGFAGPIWGDAPPFLASQQPFAIPPGANVAGGFVPGAFYQQEWQEVRDHGGETSALRSADEEEIGIFWGYDGAKGLGTPPRLYMQVVMAVLDDFVSRRASWMTQRRYLEAVAAVGVAMADAGIQAWHYKYSVPHMMWRPVLGITKAPPGMPGIVADPTWRPLGAPQTNQTDLGKLASTPNFPAYPSGHATFGASAFEILRRFIRHHDGAIAFADNAIDPIGFTFVSDEFDGRNTDLRPGKLRPRVARTYTSLWDAIVDNSESRIWLGVHWRFDGISRQVGGGAPQHGRPKNPGELGPFGGCRLGMDIAKDIATQRGFA